MSTSRSQQVRSSSHALVSATYLLGRRAVLEASKVPVLRVVAKSADRYEVETVDFSWLEAQDPRKLASVEFALAHQWAESEPEVVPEPRSSGLDSFLARWSELLDQPPEVRLANLSKQRHEFEQHLSQPQLDQAGLEEATEFAAGLAESTFLVNRVSMAIEKTALSALDKGLVDETAAVVRSVLSLVEANPASVALFRRFEHGSGSHTLDHIVRVFALVAGFLLWYNRVHRAGLVPRLRSVFEDHYRTTYTRLLPKLGEAWMRSDNVVRLPALADERIRVQALGALLHDIGKAQDLEYFEHGEGHRQDIIERHVVLGSGLFLRTYGTAFEEARAVIGEHHNYLFHPDGYGLFRWERQRTGRPAPEPRCCVADTWQAYASGESLGFLPVEVCSLADVYDALTDSTRAYKAPLDSEGALKFMAQSFVGQGKLDPVLFDLFVDYLRTIRPELSLELGFQVRVGQLGKTRGQPK